MAHSDFTDVLPTVAVTAPKVMITLRLDKVIIDYYRKTGKLWHSRINADLKFMVEQRQAAKPASRRRRTR
jgi:uncharacterized protein (DUF4415 family)